ncbi:MAG TPA: flagellar hook-associated protein FlgL [Candidatus Acidoferrales bacterium]|nr:flagellar hook-associated protein FlgL [Candidatus Acidoferrales bacterium]
MKINETQVVSDLLYSIGQSRESVDKLQEQISTGKLVNTPSDNPVLAQRLMLLQNQVNQNNVYTQNTQYASSFVTEQSSALGSAVNVLTNIKTMILSAANDQTPQDMQNYGTQLDQYINQLLDLANTKFGDKYVFGGTQTNVQPFFMNSNRSAVTANPEGVGGALKLDVGFEISDQYNITGQEAFAGGQMFTDLIAIRDELNGGTVPSQADVATVDNYLNSMINTNAKAGAMGNRFQLIQQQLSSQTQSLQTTMSNLGDTDIAAATIKLEEQQTALQAALQAGAGVVQLSLANYLSTGG